MSSCGEHPFDSIRDCVKNELVAELEFAPREPRWGARSERFEPRLERALRQGGQFPLWSHQAEALDHLARGSDLLLTTPTASGKSLIFSVPVLEAALRGEPKRAIWLFPLKALARDQLRKLEELAAQCGLDSEQFPVRVYDGDSSRRERMKLRSQPPRVLITNPEMLHLGLLPYHTNWELFLSELSWLVVDELHVYRGLFGAHLHHLIARLERIVRQRGRQLQIVASSATVAEADRFARSLFRRDFVWIQDSGAPHPRRRFWLLQPSASPYASASRLLFACLKAGQKTIAFTRARRSTELLGIWLQHRSPETALRVRSYRAGLLPEERRKIERALACGELDGVIATSALELGIDIGELDVCILLGWPGSSIAAWQRSGRVGRAGREALTVLVAFPDALDQYLLAHSHELLGTSTERLAIDPRNPWIAKPHLLAAAFEQPLERDADGAYLEPHVEMLRELVESGQLFLDFEGRRLYVNARRPHRAMSLRGGGSTFEIWERSKRKLVGTIDAVRARSEAHPEAIYLHSGSSYRVEELDLERKRVWVTSVESDHYTQALLQKETEILEVVDEANRGQARFGIGRLRVTEKVVGYQVREWFRSEVVEEVSFELPPVSYETCGIWIVFPGSALDRILHPEDSKLGALHAAEHASIGILPFVTICDRSELGGISFLGHDQLKSAGWIVYEGAEGGVGILDQVFDYLPAWIDRLAGHLEHCPCEAGCPACVFSPKCGNGNRPLDKAGARQIGVALRQWCSKEPWERRKQEVRSHVSLDLVFAAALSRQEPSEPTASRVSPEGRLPLRKSAKATPGRELVHRTVLFDLETLRSAAEVGGWDQTHHMGVALGVALELESGAFHTYREEEVLDLVALLEDADLVVGFNVLRFDYKVLSAYTELPLDRRLATLDLHDELWRKLGLRIGLARLARANLGTAKSGDGLQSLGWVREGRLDLVEAYCRRDVELLRDLYLRGQERGFLWVPNRQGALLRVPVEW